MLLLGWDLAWPSLTSANVADTSGRIEATGLPAGPGTVVSHRKSCRNRVLRVGITSQRNYCLPPPREMQGQSWALCLGVRCRDAALALLHRQLSIPIATLCDQSAQPQAALLLWRRMGGVLPALRR